jgi:DNA/RNA-binding domain of Phe-tRNA-synthetase-like protein
LALDIELTSMWRNAHPQALVGVLEIADVDNATSCPGLEHRKRQIETELRDRYRGFSRSDFARAPVLCDYVRYYKSFQKTYHVQLQLESIVLKGKLLPTISPLVDANFMAELNTLVLTAAHDAEKLEAPLSMDVSRPGDRITQMTGPEREMRPGDMIMRDAQGVCCSIIYGQDNRSAITAHTRNALYMAYAPAGVATKAVYAQLEAIVNNVRICAPGCTVRQQCVLPASQGALVVGE